MYSVGIGLQRLCFVQTHIVKALVSPSMLADGELIETAAGSFIVVEQTAAQQDVEEPTGGPWLSSRRIIITISGCHLVGLLLPLVAAIPSDYYYH